MTKLFIVLTALFVLLPSTAHATVTVTGNSDVIQLEQDGITGKWRVWVVQVVVGQTTFVNVRASSSDRIEYIRVTTNEPGVVLLTATGLNGTPNLLSVDMIERIEGDSQAPVAIIDLNVEEDVGSIRVTNIDGARIGGDLTGEINFPARNPELGSPITDLTIEGDLLGDITLAYGGIESLVVEGRIGTPTTPVSINTRGDIVNMFAGEINADIDTTAFSVDSIVREIRVESISSSSGDFIGSLIAEGVEDVTDAGVFIEGDFDGDMEFNDPLPAEREIRIGGSLTSGSSITLPAAGLEGQIVINNNDDGGTWDGVVNVDTIELDDPDYAEAAPTLGGGSVGLAPFNLHGESCEPVNGGIIEYESSLSALVRHYGPVEFSSSPLTVSRRAAGTGGSFTDVTSDFDFAAASGDANSIVVSQGMSGDGFESGYEYLIEPTSNLTSSGVVGDPEVLAYDYTFTVLIGCVADLNDDDEVNGADLAALLSVWGACGSCAADFNGDGFVNGADMAFLLATWGPCSGSLLSPTLPWVVEEFGFTSVQSYLYWVNALDEEALYEHILGVIELLLD